MKNHLLHISRLRNLDNFDHQFHQIVLVHIQHKKNLLLPLLIHIQDTQIALFLLQAYIYRLDSLHIQLVLCKDYTFRRRKANNALLMFVQNLNDHIFLLRIIHILTYLGWWYRFRGHSLYKQQELYYCLDISHRHNFRKL